jgi:release factor glutamine methyltransferase
MKSLRDQRPIICLEIGYVHQLFKKTIRYLTMFAMFARSGSGCVSAFLGRILGPSACQFRRFQNYAGASFPPNLVVYLCTDINERAARCTLATGRQNDVAIYFTRSPLQLIPLLIQVVLDPITASLASPLRSRLKHSIDVLLFNPPYVPTDTHEANFAQSSGDIQGSWAGGVDGMQITNRFLDEVKVVFCRSPPTKPCTKPRIPILFRICCRRLASPI